MKRTFDIVISLVILICFLPIGLIVSILIVSTSSGGLFYRQIRIGRNGIPFRIFKFRSMRTDADKAGKLTVGMRDPRITPIGIFIRKYKLDEFPQFINVLIGEMSIVGPRPHAVDHNESYRSLIPGYMQRHAFKPGLTGLAQVEGFRGETLTIESMANRIEADLRYQREWTLELDLAISLRTVVSLWTHKAY